MQIKTFVSFEWFRADRHELVPEGKLEPGERKFSQSAVRATVPEVWRRRIRAIGPPGLKGSPLDQLPGLFRDFADLTYDPDRYLDFANQFGLLIGRKNQRVFEVAAFHAIVRAALGHTSNDMPLWLSRYLKRVAVGYSEVGDQADNPGLGADLAECRAFDSDPRAHLFGLVRYGCRTAVEPDPESNRPIVVLRPVNLCVAIALQAVVHLSGHDEDQGIKLFQCEWCGTHFKVGPGTGRRSRAKFCSRKCQDAHSNSLKKLRREGALAKLPDLR
jgi:hypothetical protein